MIEFIICFAYVILAVLCIGAVGTIAFFGANFIYFGLEDLYYSISDKIAERKRARRA